MSSNTAICCAVYWKSLVFIRIHFLIVILIIHFLCIAKKSLDTVLRRPPLVILEGDVGAGKTELASTIGDAVARQEKIDITLFPLSLATRGQGLVGEMTKLLSEAFDYTVQKAEKLKGKESGARGAIIMLVDEADALAQTRETNQMNHEDKAGVNAFIRGIDRLGNYCCWCCSG